MPAQNDGAPAHCAAPDEGSMNLLRNWANEEHTERYLVPLPKGETFSAFSMTEPPGAGSDPRMIQTRAIRDVPVMGIKDFAGRGSVPLDATRDE
ncbi:MAG: hypothetical protein OXI77_14970 [Chloroflexota bacterium]|nr:hypothetical protein [Chloroflexota bacterium]